MQNGVVHLIDQPLVILAKSVWEMLDPTKPVSTYILIKILIKKLESYQLQIIKEKRMG